jgi:hypothetical protein
VKVFLDANILFSASAAHSRVRLLIYTILQTGSCVTSAYAIEEAKRNLVAKQFGSLETLNTLLTQIGVDNRLVLELPVPLPTKDIPIMAGAIATHSTHLLTGDKQDFGFLFGKTISGVKVISPRLMAEELVSLGLLTEQA